jgi:inorganic triphosphatase YgiF
MPEREAKLVITAPRPGVIADAIAGLVRLGDRALVPVPTVRIRDVYLDTPSGVLRARRDSLRVREEDGRAWLTLKGPGREVEAGVMEREELETAWSPEAYAHCLELLAARGVAVRRAPPGADPVATMLASGLTRVQERSTERRRRHAQGPPSPLAELAIDAVTYRLAAGAVDHHEVEIEAKAPEGAGYLGRAIQDLRVRFGEALTPWRHGKLATGFAIERLLASPDGAGMVAEGHLAPAAYPRLAALLSGERDASPD